MNNHKVRTGLIWAAYNLQGINDILGEDVYEYDLWFENSDGLYAEEIIVVYAQEEAVVYHRLKYGLMIDEMERLNMTYIT